MLQLCCLGTHACSCGVLFRRVAGKAKAAAAAANARQDVTLALSQALPSLLRKFQTDPTKVSPVCSVSHPLCPHMPDVLHELLYSLPEDKRQEKTCPPADKSPTYPIYPLRGHLGP